jgi:hypothetical protein
MEPVRGNLAALGLHSVKDADGIHPPELSAGSVTHSAKAARISRGTRNR